MRTTVTIRPGSAAEEGHARVTGDAAQGIAPRQPPDHVAGPIPKGALDEIECVSDAQAGNGRVQGSLQAAACTYALHSGHGRGKKY